MLMEIQPIFKIPWPSTGRGEEVQTDEIIFQIQTTYQWQTNSHTQLCFSHHNRDVRMKLMVLSPYSGHFFPHSGAEEYQYSN